MESAQHFSKIPQNIQPQCPGYSEEHVCIQYPTTDSDSRYLYTTPTNRHLPMLHTHRNKLIHLNILNSSSPKDHITRSTAQASISRSPNQQRLPYPLSPPHRRLRSHPSTPNTVPIPKTPFTLPHRSPARHPCLLASPILLRDQHSQTEKSTKMVSHLHYAN